MVRVVTLIGVGILCSAVWLELLVATRFATITVSLGLLGALVVIGMSERPDRTTD